MPEGEIHIHRYTLRSRAVLNAVSPRTEHEGVLLRLDHGGLRGYGCIHPWPELGDADLEQSLSLLQGGEYTTISNRAMQCAKVDATARHDGVSLFDGLSVPRSHATLMMDEDECQRAVDAGFEIVKVKVGRDVASETGFLREQAGRFPQLRWRLDFNGVMGVDKVESFLAGLGEDVCTRIDFIEDAYRPELTPTVPSCGPFGIPMAVDRQVDEARGGFQLAVIKPAVNDPGPILDRAAREGKKVVFTSYMDHPLGQCFAAWEAARAINSHPGVVDTCGLITHGLFEPDAFTEALGMPGPDFSPPAGTGLGFDDLLESLSWEPLT